MRHYKFASKIKVYFIGNHRPLLLPSIPLEAVVYFNNNKTTTQPSEKVENKKPLLPLRSVPSSQNLFLKI